MSTERTELEAPATEETAQLENAAASDAAQPEIEEEERVPASVQKKFDKLTAQRETARRQNRDLQARLESIERKLEAKPPSEQATIDKADPKPDYNNWTGSPEDFTEALSRWAARQEHQQLSAKEREAAEAADRDEEAREVVRTFQARIDDFVEEHEDYNEIVGTIKMSAKVGAGVQNFMYRDENGPELAYYLGNHPELQAKLDAMAPELAVAYMGRIAERLFPETDTEKETDDDDADEADESPVTPLSPKAKTTQAPVTIKPVRRSAPTSTGLRDDMSTDDWLKVRQAQLRKAGRQI